jgi:mannose-6-phosphate isomerase-like protein (cupin superfamily)
MPSHIPYSELPRSHSTRDNRQRIDLVTEELFGTTELKADHISYQPGDTAAAHHHVGAKHYFFVDAGSGVLHLDDRIHRLSVGDVAFADEGEVHWFENDGDQVFSFYELWVPTPSETIWAVEHDR